MDGRREVVRAVGRAAEDLGVAVRLWGEALAEQERSDLETLAGVLTIYADDLEEDDDAHN